MGLTGYAFPHPHDALSSFKAYANEAERLHAFEQAGLEVEHDPEGFTGRGLLIGRKPST